MSDVTRILSAIEQGNPAAADELLPLVYGELRKLAAKLSHEKTGLTLQPTALVHEAYVWLVAGQHPKRWNDRGHFFAAALGVTVYQARQKWTYARAWLRDAMKKSE